MRQRPARSNYQHLARKIFAQHTNGLDLDTWLLERRKPIRDEPPASWRRIAAELHYLTDGDLDPAVQTLVWWHDAAVAQAVAA